MFEQIDVLFILNSILLGVGLAMDAFSVSIVNGLNEPKMKPARMSTIAGCYAFFQFAMPMIGWFLVHSLIGVFKGIEPFVPWVALLLLLFIGGKMILESVREIRDRRKKKDYGGSFCINKEKGEDSEKEEKQRGKLTFALLILQGLATSIDALSVGLTIAEYNAFTAFLAAFLIAVVTFVICMVGLKIGKFVGNKLGVYAGIFGGSILIGIGIEIFLKGILG